jgi:hypothetical protein
VSFSSIGTSLIGLLFLFAFLGLMVGFSFIRRDHPNRDLREIPSFARLRRAIGLAVEAGQRLHIALGDGGIQGQRGGPGLIGLSVVQRVARTAAINDRPPTASSGEATLAILSQDVLREGYREVGAENRFDPAAGQLSGLTSFSFAAGALPVIYDQQVAVNLIIGSFGSEVALLADAAERTESLTIGGSDNLAAQAILLASSQEPLIGEELFAAGAYLQVNKMHTASLFAQDVLRWVLIVILLIGATSKFLGLI